MLSDMTAPVDDLLPVSDLEPPARSAIPRVLGVTVAVLLLAAVVSVLLRGDERSPAERFAAIPAAVSEEPFGFEISITGTVTGLANGIDLTLTGAADPTTRRTKAEMDLSSIIPAGAGIPSTMSMVSEGAVTYLLVPAPGGGAPQWTKIDGGALTQGATGGLPSGTNPLDSFEQLRAVDTEIEEVGEEDVRGTRTTHYRTRIDMQKVLETMPPERRPPSTEQLAALGDVPVDVWLDDEDRPRRQLMTFDLPGDTGTMTIVVETFDFGTPVVIEVPPADQVVDGAGMFGQPPR